MNATADSIRLEQGTSNEVAGRRIGVMNVFEENGALIAQLAVNTPSTGDTDTLEVNAGDVVKLGTGSYRIVTITPGKGGARASLEIAPVGGN
jgi:hypothetical protein